jgi:hypothetical protein
VLNANQIIAITGVAMVTVATTAIWASLRGVRHQLWLQTFAEYTRRYAEIAQQIPSHARTAGGAYRLDALDEDERDRLLNLARSYINLCSEEHYLHGRGRIDPETWRLWTLGIQSMFELEWFCEAWTRLSREYAKYEAFHQFFVQCEKTPSPRTTAP